VLPEKLERLEWLEKQEQPEREDIKEDEVIRVDVEFQEEADSLEQLDQSDLLVVLEREDLQDRLVRRELLDRSGYLASPEDVVIPDHKVQWEIRAQQEKTELEVRPDQSERLGWTVHLDTRAQLDRTERMENQEMMGHGERLEKTDLPVKMACKVQEERLVSLVSRALVVIKEPQGIQVSLVQTGRRAGQELQVGQD